MWTRRPADDNRRICLWIPLAGDGEDTDLALCMRPWSGLKKKSVRSVMPVKVSVVDKELLQSLGGGESEDPFRYLT